jgi:ABC-type multidrug transport system ATPase subunit
MKISEETIGSSESCNIVLPDTVGLLPFHATLARCGGRIFLRREEAGGCTRINGAPISVGRWQEIAKGDRVRLGELEIEVSARLFYGDRRFRLLARDLIRKSRGGRILSNVPGVAFRPGELVAVMGPSGAGKSMLLEMLSGTVAPDSGRLWLEDAKGSAWVASPGNGIGFVSQEDHLVPELTVRESLEFRLRLQFPDMVPRIRDILIKEACASLGLGTGGIDAFLCRHIGTREDRKRGVLSGGERRRLAIAHELVGQAAVLVLDEPTSGLSSVEAERVLEVLRKLSHEKAIPVILSLHQPGRDAFAKIDRLILIGPGSSLLFDGSVAEAVAAIEAIRREPRGDGNAAEYILAAAVDPDLCRQMQANAAVTAAARKPGIPENIDEAVESEVVRTPVEPGRLRCFLHRGTTLAVKSFRVLIANPVVPGLMLAQAAGIAILMILALHGFERDESDRNQFLRVAEHFQSLKAPFEEQGLPIPVDRLMREAEELARSGQGDPHRLDPSSATRRGSVYFLLATASIWFGLIASCREVVAEAKMLRTDVRAGRHSVLAYVLAKLVVLAIFSGTGVAVLTFIAVPLILDLSLGAAIRIAGILCLVSTASVALGLAVSALSRSSRIALTLVPLLILPQLLFSGFIRPVGPAAPEATGAPGGIVTYAVRGAVSHLMLQRWGFAACLNADPFAYSGVTDYEYAPGMESRYSKFNRLSFSDTGMLSRFFPGTEPGASAVLNLVVWLIIALVAAWGACGWRANRGDAF